MKRVLLPLLILLITCLSHAQSGGELRFVLRGEPRTFNPILVTEDYSETVRYLTGGFLLRLNRQTQKLEPGLASSWKVTDGGKQITFKLRANLFFSDGTPFTTDDVVYTFQQMMAPSVHSPIADEFRSGNGPITAKAVSKTEVAIRLPAPIAGLDRIFDQVAIMTRTNAPAPWFSVVSLRP